MKRAILSVLIALGTAASAAGCSSDAEAGTSQAGMSEQHQSDINCLDGMPASRTDYYDLNGDTHPDTFLIMRCTATTDPPGDQLEIVGGGEGSAADHPTKLVPLEWAAVVDRLCFFRQRAVYRVTREGKSEIWQVSWPNGETLPRKPVPGPKHGCP